MNLLEVCCKAPELWDEVLRCIQNALIVTDLEGLILFGSPNVEDILGFTAVELKERHFSIFVTPEDVALMYHNLFYMARREMSFEGEIMLVRKDETRFIAYITTRPCYDPHGDRTVVVISIRDIDEMKRQLRKYRDSKYEDMIKVANGIAHELRNPLVGIGGFVNRLFKALGNVSDHQAYYDHIMTNLHKIETLVRKVEFFAHLPKPALTRSSLQSVVQESLESYLPLVEKRGIEVSLAVDDIVLTIDRDLIIKVLSIMIENSLDVLARGGRISIWTEAQDNYCVIFVADTGTGISPADLPYIFNPFFSTKASGAGIDLATVKRVVEGHGGYVDVKSQQGDGTTFSLHFPVERRRPIRIMRMGDDRANGSSPP